jgi:AraC family transcriptional regulator, ethanolamine operon transcriptional activator
MNGREAGAILSSAMLDRSLEETLLRYRYAQALRRKPAMPTKSFSSFEDFFDANRHASLRAMVLGSGRGSWVLTNLMVGKLGLQFGEASTNAVVEGAPQPGGISIFLLTQGLSAMTGNGQRFDEISMLVAQPGDEFCIAADSWRRWCSLYIPNEFLAAAKQDSLATAGCRRGVMQLPLHRIARFRAVIQQLDESVQRAPDSFRSAAAQKAAQQKLVLEVLNVLAVPSDVEPKPGRHVVPRNQIIRQSMEFVEQHNGEYLSVEQLAIAAGVSERTLRDAFQHYFGVAPVRYLNRRTLHQVRRALKAADPTVATVTEIATQFGVWQLGRFARDYRLLFGELPAETLRQTY